MPFKNIIKHPIIKFIFKFLFFSLLFYYSIQFFQGITSPGGLYYPFMDKYLNFIKWYRAFLLQLSHISTNMVGYPSYVSDKYHLQIIGGYSIQLVYSCLGFALIGVWFSFLIAYPSALRKKIKWAFIGLLVITILNTIRIASIAIIASNLRKSDLDFHHDIFNAIVYIIIIIMIYFFTKEKRQNNLK